MRPLPRRPAATPRKRLFWSVVPALALGAMAAALVPRGYDAGALLLALARRRRKPEARD